MHNPSLHLRRAHAGDEIAISSVLLEAFRLYLPQYTPAGFAATTPSPSEVQRRMEEGPVWLAMIESDIVGTVSVVLRGERALYIRGMAVLPQARGQGIGNLLFELIYEYAKEHGCTKLVLSTTPFLDRAIRLYEKLGFVRTGEGPHDLHGTPLFTMEKSID
ncbi:MAG TPA: GNAT family N-acetyltransferase [Pyrinomonadaceae bacterium]